MSKNFKPFRKAAVLGAGVMGSQIAAHLANAGLEVVLLDIPAKEGPKNAIVAGAFKKATRMKPNPFFVKGAQKRITLGNFDDDLSLLKDCDWVIEAIIERLDIKQSLMAKVQKAINKDTIVSSNTSGLPIDEITEGRSLSFKKRFLGTHFFNPPRYLKLFEIIPSPNTNPKVVRRLAWFARVHLGKGVVIAKDTPNFIGNRIGVYSMVRTIKEFTEGRFNIKEIDAVTGTLIGRPKSATFRTADVVGLDTLIHVINNLYDGVPDDEERDMFEVPQILKDLVEKGYKGAKTKSGFYKKIGKDILSINPANMEFEQDEVNVGDLDSIKDAGGLEDRLRALYASDSRAGSLFRDTTLDILAYSARRLPEISDSPADVDRAIRWGFGYRLGPFETWDVLGFDRICNDLEAAGKALPDWIEEMKASGRNSFYDGEPGAPTIYLPGKGSANDEVYKDVIDLDAIRSNPRKIIWKNADANLLDLGNQVVLYEFRSKANSLGTEVMSGLDDVITLIEGKSNIRGLVIGNQGNNFSVGANLGELAMGVMMGQLDDVEMMLKRFQEVVQRVRYANKPIVVATHQRVLGGGCELTMASPQPVAASESYIGLVELGVGLIPAGTGSMYLAAKAAEKSPTDFPSHITAFLRKYFENVAMAKVATSAAEAIEMGYLPDNTIISMNEDRRLYIAKEEVTRLSNVGYLPPPVKSAIRVMGSPARALFEAALHQFEVGKFISEYDHYLGSKLAYVMTGGSLTGPTDVHEDYLIDLEREVFMHLLGQEKTMARVQSILTTGKPLRN